MRKYDEPARPREDEPDQQLLSGFTVRPADFETQAGTRISWNEARIVRNEVKLPPPPRRPRAEVR
jgi:hypothetical protein